MSESASDMVEIIVMFKDGHTKEDAAPLADSVQAPLVEVRMMFEHKVVALIAVAASAAATTLNRLQKDERVEIAQINRTYKHC
jgi:hypothetical protein